MIVEINKDNINILNNSFISTEIVEKEFSSNPFARLFILLENNEIVGYIYYSDIYERAEINQFEIKKIHRNCGKGNFLLKETINIINKDITLEVRNNNYPAITLYKKNGFKEVSIRKNYYEDSDGILMERKKTNWTLLEK